MFISRLPCYIGVPGITPEQLSFWYPKVRFHVMPTIKLTARTVETLKPPAAGRDEWWDSSLPGFGIRITDKGTRSWVLVSHVRRRTEKADDVGYFSHAVSG